MFVLFQEKLENSSRFDRRLVTKNLSHEFYPYWPDAWIVLFRIKSEVQQLYMFTSVHINVSEKVAQIKF